MSCIRPGVHGVCAQSAAVGGTEDRGAEDDGEWVMQGGAPWDGRSAASINRFVSDRQVSSGCYVFSVMALY